MQSSEGRIAIYSRKSKFTGKGESVGNQVELCRDYVRNMFGESNAQCCEIFEDEGFSGGDLKRPAFQKMMGAVRKRKIQAIVVYRLDRISRNISDFAGLIDELTGLDVSFISIREQFDTGTPMGRAMMFIISVFSQLERETIAERIRDNMHELAKTGRWLGGNTPLGFRSEAVSKVTVDGKTRKSFKLTPIPEESEIPKLIFDLFSQTGSLTEVEAQLLHRRVRTKQGKNFTRFAIKGILQNPVYMIADGAAYRYFTQRKADVCFPEDSFDGSRGIMAYNRTQQQKGRANVLLPMDQWIIALGAHEGLIPSGQWIQAQIALERNRSKAYRSPRNNEALLTGLLFCSCGGRMYPKLSQRRWKDGKPVYTYVCKMKEKSKGEYCCRPNVQGNLLDAMVMEQLKGLTEDEQNLLAQLKRSRTRYQGNQGKREAHLTQLREELAANERSIRGLLDALALAEDPAVRGYVLDRIEELTQANREIESYIRGVEDRLSAGHLSAEQIASLERTLLQFSQYVDVMPLEEKRRAVRTVIRKVIWDGEQAHALLAGQEEEVDDKVRWCEDSK